MTKTNQTNANKKVFKKLAWLVTLAAMFAAAPAMADSGAESGSRQALFLTDAAFDKSLDAANQSKDFNFEAPGMVKLAKTPSFGLESTVNKLDFTSLDGFFLSVTRQDYPENAFRSDPAQDNEMLMNQDYPSVTSANLLNSSFAKMVAIKLTSTE